MKTRFSFLFFLLMTLMAAGLLWSSTPAGTCQAQTQVCPVPAVDGRQPLPNELLPMFKNASANTMGTTGPSLPTKL